MKSRVLKTSAGGIIFLSLVIAVIALINPVYTKINNVLSSEAVKIVKQLDEKTGLKISYDSLSPSILSGINIRGISVYDEKNGHKLVQINRATLSYKLKDLLSRNPVNGIKMLLLDGVTVEFNAVKDDELFENFKLLFAKDENSEKNSKSRKKDSQENSSRNFTLEGRRLNIPFDIQFKNISLHYEDSKNDFLMTVKSIQLENVFNRHGEIFLKLAGRLEYRTDYLKKQNYRSLVGCGFELSGTLYENLEGSSFMLKFSEMSRADYTLSKMDLLLTIADNDITFRTMKNSLPYTLMADANFINQTLSLHATSSQFEILKLLRIKNSSGIYSKFLGTVVDGRIDASASFAPDVNFVESLNFEVESSVRFPPKALGSALEMGLSASCQKGNVAVNRLFAQGKPLGFDFSGNYNLADRQPSGILTLDHLVLNNGGTLQTEVYIDPYQNGFMMFAPQLFMDQRSYTAIQFTVLPSTRSVDFTLEFDDYSHADYEKSGHVKIDGSFLGENSVFVQASMSVNDMFLDSILKTAAFFAPENTAASLNATADSVEPFIFSDELFFTTDFKDFSFNAPFFIIANTKKERQLITFSADGSNQTVSLSSLDLQFGEQTAHASAGIDFAGGFKDFNFYSDLVVNTLPYSITGSYGSGFVSVAGDYGFTAAVNLDKNISGSAEVSQLPFKAGKNIFALTANTAFSWSMRSGFEIDISNFDLDEPSGNISIKPHFAFSGSANKYGFVMNKMAYSDTSGALEGKSTLAWSYTDGIVDSLNFELNAKSILSTEKIHLSLELNNPERRELSSENIKNNFYASAQGSVESFPSSRFVSDQNSENTVNADFSLSGTLSNPFVSLQVKKSSVNLAGYPAVFECNAVYDDAGVAVSDLKVDWSTISISDFMLFFNPKTFAGDVTAKVTGKFLDLDFNIPVKAAIESLSPGKNPSSNVLASITSEKMTGSLFPTAQKMDIAVTKTPGIINIISGNGRGISATIMDGQIVSARSGPDSPLKFDLNGSVIHNNLDLNFTNISSDLKKLSQTVSIPFVSFTAGELSGAIKLSGITTDPEYTGDITVVKPEFYVTYVSKKLFKTDSVHATAGQGHFIVKPQEFTLDKNPVTVGVDIAFDRWGIEYLECPISTAPGQYIPVDMDFPFIHYKGYGGFDNFLIRVLPSQVEFTGKIIGEKADINISTSGIENLKETEPLDFDFLVDLSLQVKNRVQILFNPLLRGVIVPDSSLQLFIDTRTNDFGARGEVNLRGGEIVWLNRNFYMKEGKVLFNESHGIFDPRVTVRAETRERDENNTQVTIVLSAVKQPLSTFNPTFSSTPAKSEKEIMELLGQVISADSENAASLALAGGDYLMQATVMRGIENALREVCNFDIFSIRTNILQNAVKQSLQKNSANKQMSFGNFFDNSAVYVGKYFGSDMYVDALMHWSYDDSKAADKDSVKGLTLQPQFGLEMNSPFVNIRLGIAPDLDAIQNSLWIPSTSITLSWKHSF